MGDRQPTNRQPEHQPERLTRRRGDRTKQPSSDGGKDESKPKKSTLERLADRTKFWRRSDTSQQEQMAPAYEDVLEENKQAVEQHNTEMMNQWKLNQIREARDRGAFLSPVDKTLLENYERDEVARQRRNAHENPPGYN